MDFTELYSLHAGCQDSIPYEITIDWVFEERKRKNMKYYSGARGLFIYLFYFVLDFTFQAVGISD